MGVLQDKTYKDRIWKLEAKGCKNYDIKITVKKGEHKFCNMNYMTAETRQLSPTRQGSILDDKSLNVIQLPFL
jgi:hypothetical protein